MHTLTLYDLLFSFIPAALVIGVMIYQSLQYKTALYAMARMLLQLLLIGYFLIYIFETETSVVILLTLSIMLIAAGWISLRTVEKRRNTLFAVGLVSLPGMMTGQILSEVSPLIAARYQIMVMAMIFGASGLSVLLFLKLVKSNFVNS